MQAVPIRAHVSADERYELYVDGELVGRGPERGDAFHWFFETYDLPLFAGSHTIVARVWAFGDSSPVAQMSVRPGFIFAAETQGEQDELGHKLSTGSGYWEAKVLPGYSYTYPTLAWGANPALTIDGSAFAWGFERGEGEGWAPAIKQGLANTSLSNYGIETVRLLRPATLPAMMDARLVPGTGTVRHISAPPVPGADIEGIQRTTVIASDHLADEVTAWHELLHQGTPVTIPADTCRRVIIDLDNYFCVYPAITTSGGAGSLIRVQWAEALFEKAWAYTPKGNRSEIEGKHFVGAGDTFLPDGGNGRQFDTLWWHAGRYVEIVIQTSDQPLTIDRLTLRETRYPVEMESRFDASDGRLAQILPILVRGVQMCSHETYMDTPYWEQLQYVGDTRLEVLCTHIMTRDDRLPRKALHMFDASRLPSGLTYSRYPSRVFQVIPPFSLWWVAMVSDHLMWRGDMEFVRSLLPGVRGVIDAWYRKLGGDGLIRAPEGWNYMDWVNAWPGGVPVDGVSGVSGMLNWHVAHVLGHAMDLEAAFGEKARASRLQEMQGALVGHLDAFWDEGRGLYADDLTHAHFSEQTQCLALLSGQLDSARQARVAEALVHDPGLTRASIYFRHYLFEAFRVTGRADALFALLPMWFDLEKNGFKTGYEYPEPSRSDCHGWASHPLYHYFASILGIRPASPGFGSVHIEPLLGPLTHASGTLVHPRGEISVDFHVVNGRLKGQINLPQGVAGNLVYPGQHITLHEGSQDI